MIGMSPALCTWLSLLMLGSWMVTCTIQSQWAQDKLHLRNSFDQNMNRRHLSCIFSRVLSVLPASRKPQLFPRIRQHGFPNLRGNLKHLGRLDNHYRALVAWIWSQFMQCYNKFQAMVYKDQNLGHPLALYSNSNPWITTTCSPDCIQEFLQVCLT